MKQKIRKVSINVPEDIWYLFKILCGKHLHRNEDGTARASTASDNIREFLHEYIYEQSHHLAQILEELKVLKIRPSIIALLEEEKEFYNEGKQPEDKEWGT